MPRRMRMPRAGLIALMIALGPVLGGCVASTRLSRTDEQRIAGRTYVIVGASSGFGRGAAIAPPARGIAGGLESQDGG